MYRQIIHTRPWAFLRLHGCQMYPRIGIPNANRPVLRPTQQVSGVINPGMWAMEVQTSDCPFMLIQWPHVLLCIDVEHLDGVIRSARGHHCPTGGYTFDGANVRWVRKCPLQLLLLLLHLPTPKEPLVWPGHQLHTHTRIARSCAQWSQIRGKSWTQFLIPKLAALT